MFTVTYRTSRASIAGWRYFWAKSVLGFNPSVHCARCLIGSYVRDIGTRMLVNTPIPVDLPEGTFFYICGVSSPYRWPNNFHLAVRVKQGAACSLPTYNGDTVAVHGAEQLPIPAEDAARLFPTRGKEYLTCRNFQFAVSVADQLPAAKATKAQIDLDLR